MSLPAYRIQWQIFCWLWVTGAAISLGQANAAPAPPLELTVEPNHSGSIVVTWQLSSEDNPGAVEKKVAGYRLRREAEDLDQSVAKTRLRTEDFERLVDEIVVLPDFTADTTTFIDRTVVSTRQYTYFLTAIGPDGSASDVVVSEVVTPKPKSVLAILISIFDGWVYWDKLPLLGVTVVICGGLIISTEMARRGKPIYIRPIAGLQAIEEAVGRATEMGRPMLYVPGIMDLNEIQTVAGVTVLSHVAQTAAQYDMPLDVPTARSLVMTAARDAVEAGCLKADRPEVYDANRVYYVTDDQFSFVAHVGGRMIREKPAACFYIGQFFAESLLLAETGNSVGAIQVAGTAEASQLPFFVAACDYTLLGEEMFAASAYLSREPEQLGMLRGQDFAKLLAGVMIIGGCGWNAILAEWELVAWALSGPQ